MGTIGCGAGGDARDVRESAGSMELSTVGPDRAWKHAWKGPSSGGYVMARTGDPVFGGDTEAVCEEGSGGRDHSRLQSTVSVWIGS